MQECSNCRKKKDPTKFRKHRRACRACEAEYNKRWRESDPDSALRNKRSSLRRYGITLEDYQALLAKQEGKCAICGNGQSSKFVSLDVDHCHRTGKVRGLLCSNCNSGLGRFSDKVTLLKSAIKYIRKHRS